MKPKPTNANQPNGAAEALVATLISSNETAADSDRAPANVVDGLFAIARAIENLAVQVKHLGFGDAATNMGATEGLAMKIESASERIAGGIGDAAPKSELAAPPDPTKPGPGFVGYDGEGRFVHYCACGEWGSFGYNVSLRTGRLGTWYCREHRPQGPEP